MKVKLIKMNQEEYDVFYQKSFEHHVRELILEEKMSEKAAEKETTEELRAMLPEGLNTENNYLMTIFDEKEEPVGFIWTLHEYSEDIKQSFLCDFEIYEKDRRKGYASESLKQMENDAKQAGCRESVLFVADENAAAIALYEKCGYVSFREFNYGKYMKKTL